jgi:adenylate cyclase
MDPEAKQRQLFAVLCKEVREGNVASQLVTLIEDLHWMDAGSEAFLEQWVEAIAGSRALLIVNFRPEYHAAWSWKSYYARFRWRRWEPSRPPPCNARTNVTPASA